METMENERRWGEVTGSARGRILYLFSTNQTKSTEDLWIFKIRTCLNTVEYIDTSYKHYRIIRVSYLFLEKYN